MKLKDITYKFMDNSMKFKRRIVLHWTGSDTADSPITWLNFRKKGLGSVGYNYIIDKDGTIYVLADPKLRWMHNTGLGSNYDKNVISISFVNMGDGDFTEKQLLAAKGLVKNLKEDFNITMITHHHNINPKKPDFPIHVWDKIKGNFLSDEEKS